MTAPADGEPPERPRLSTAGDLIWPERDKQMGPWRYDILESVAHPFPMHWLFRRPPGAPRRVVNLFAGAGGWEQGLRLLDPESTGFDVVGIEIAFDASATAMAAGRRRIIVDVRSIPPDHPALAEVEGLIVSAPCQVWTPAGLRQGREDENIQLLLDCFTLAFEASFGHWHDSGPCEEQGDCAVCDDPTWDGYSGFTGPLITLEEAREPVQRMTDERIGLIAEALIWSLTLTARYDRLRWLAMEQSSALPEVVLDGLREELFAADWCSARYEVLDAADAGLASHRRRVYLLAERHGYVGMSRLHPSEPVPARTAAEALGWPEGIRINTRGERKTQGGNEWSADRTAPAITSKIRGWYQVGDPTAKFTVPQSALLVGMPATYPWTGSRTSASQQLGDIVAPSEAARVLGALLRLPWEEPVQRYLDELYGPESRALAAEPEAPRRSTRASAARATSPMLPGLAELFAPPGGRITSVDPAGQTAPVVGHGKQ